MASRAEARAEVRPAFLPQDAEVCRTSSCAGIVPIYATKGRPALELQPATTFGLGGIVVQTTRRDPNTTVTLRSGTF